MYQQSYTNFFTNDVDVIYDLSKNNDEKNKEHNQNTVCDLSKNKETHDKNSLHDFSPTAIGRTAYWKVTSQKNQDSNINNELTENVSSFNKITDIDKVIASYPFNKNIYPYSIADLSAQERNQITNNATAKRITHNQQITKQYSVPPVATTTLKENFGALQIIDNNEENNVDVSVQTEEVFEISEDEWILLNFIKFKGNFENMLLSDSECQENKRNKYTVNETLPFYNKIKNNKTDIKYNKSETSSKTNNNRMLECVQETTNAQINTATEIEILQAKRKKVSYLTVASKNPLNFPPYHKEHILADSAAVHKYKTIIPQHSQRKYNRSTSGRYVNKPEINLHHPVPHQKQNVAEMEAMNRQLNVDYNGKKTQVYQAQQPLSLPYVNQQVNYLELPPATNIHFGPIQENNQYISIPVMENPMHQQADLQGWSGERSYMNLQLTSNSNNTRQNDTFIRNSSTKEVDLREMGWESQVNSYPNTDWKWKRRI